MDYNYKDLIPIRKGDDVEVRILLKLFFDFLLLKLVIGFFL